MKRALLTVAAVVSGCLGPLLPLPPAGSAPAEHPALDRERAAAPARAYLITSETQLLPGAAADGRVGDYRLDNDVVSVVVSQPSHVVGFAASGGNVVDAAPSGGHDELAQLRGYLADTFGRQPVYERVVTADKEGTAFVTVSGHDSDAPEIAVETEYSLAPGAHALRIESRISNGTREALVRFAVGDSLDWGRAEPFVPERGFAQDGRLTTEAGFALGLGGESAYAYVVAEGPLDGVHGWASSSFDAQVVDLPPGQSVRTIRWLVTARPSDPALYDAVAAIRQQRWPHLVGRILEESSGESLAGARVQFFDDHGAVAVTRSATTGFEAALPPGDYRVLAEGLGRSGPAALDVTVEKGASTTHDILMSRTGALAFTVRDERGAVPARLTILPLGAARAPYLGPRYASPGGQGVLTATGEGEVPLAPGQYRVIASRGPEYTADEERVTVPPGQRARVLFQLRHAVDAFGWRCVDPHQHASPSPDSAVSLADRLTSDLSEGLETVVATDHDVMGGEWHKAAAELRAARPLAVLVGDEIALDRERHVSVIPATAGAHVAILDRPHAGVRAESLARALPAIVDEWKRGGPGSAGAARGAARGDTIDAVEIWSGKDSTKVEPAMRDWLALLDRGLSFTAVAGSDSHLISGQEVGWPRTCFPVAQPGAPVDAEALVGAIKRRREALLTNGPFVRVAVAGKGMGQLAPAPRGRARLDVEIQAAPWIDVRRIEVFINGSRRGKPILLPAANKPLRYQGGIDLHVERDAYVVVMVSGDAPLSPILATEQGQPPPTPLAITNPIYLDRDGDGRFTPPLHKEIR